MNEQRALPGVVIVTGTGTEIGKTVATAALAVTLRGNGLRVVVVKLVQTGVGEGEPGDVDEVRRLAGEPLTTAEWARLPDPLAPASAARLSGMPLPTIAEHARRIADLAGEVDIVLVEGSGGLLVQLDTRGGTLADLAVGLRYKGIGTGVFLVAAAGLGTLNATALTAEALTTRSVPLLGVIIGSWPTDPGLAEQTNLQDLPTAAGARLRGTIPAGAGALSTEEFVAAAPTWLDLS